MTPEKKSFALSRPSPAELKEILKIVSEQVPGLLEKLSNLLYSPAAAKKYGKSVANFYQELVGSGMNSNQAFELTKQYMAALNPGTVVGNLGGLSKQIRETGDHEASSRFPVFTILSGYHVLRLRCCGNAGADS